MVLLYVPDRRAEDTKVAFDDVPEGWRVAVELDAAGTAAGHHSGAYVAPSYDALVDAPVEIGHFDEYSHGGRRKAHSHCGSRRFRRPLAADGIAEAHRRL